MRALLYDLLKRGASLYFNTLNVLLGGNLPPFGSAAVIVEEQDCYLVVELPGGRVVFPGGFMTWREDPKRTAQREAQEETGLLVSVDHLIGTYFCASDSFMNMSTVCSHLCCTRRVSCSFFIATISTGLSYSNEPLVHFQRTFLGKGETKGTPLEPRQGRTPASPFP